MQRTIDRLTERQKDCLRLVGDGYTSKEIGRRLAISPATVDNHVRAALESLRVESRAEAARLLRAEETSQPLTSQPPAIAEPGPIAATLVLADSRRRSWWHRLFPPMGGTRNTLGPEAKTFAIIRVAVLSLAGVMILAIAAAVLLWLLR